jgi:PAS domain S-box-containing protein
MVDRAGLITFWNNAASDLFGYQQEEIVGHDLNLLMPSEKIRLQEFSEANPSKETEGEKGFEGMLELPAHRKDGSEFTAELSLNYITMKGKNFAIGTVRDITERKRVEEEIRQLNEDLDQRVHQRTLDLEAANQELQQREAELKKHSLAIEQSPAIVVITDLEGTIEYVNPAFTRVTGYSREEAIGQNPRILKSGRHSREFYEALWGTITSGRVWSGEFSNKRKNGTLYWETTTISPIRNKVGEITHFVAVKEDITDRKKMETEMLQNLEDLEKFSSIAIGREERMIDLKDEVNTLREKLGKGKKYEIVE